MSNVIVLLSLISVICIGILPHVKAWNHQVTWANTGILESSQDKREIARQ